MFFVSGITGQVGGAAARRLLAEGRPVRALVRDPRKATEWARQGVDVQQGDFNDAASVARAMKGVEAAFLMLPPFFAPAPGFPEARALITSYLEALHEAPPPRLVVLSSVGAEKRSGLGHITVAHLLEEALDGLSLPMAFVRAGSFLENYTRALDAAATTGRFDSLWTPTHRAFPVVATEDIGQEVARLLVEGWKGRKVVEIGTRRSPEELARAMGEVLGQPVQAQAVPREQWTAVLSAQGMPPRAIEPMTEMVDSYNSGWIDFGVPGTEPVAGTLTPAQLFARARTARGGH